MAKQTLSFTVDAAYVYELGSALTRYIASDPDAVLTNTTMEGASSISISDWETVAETIRDNIHLWIYQISTKQALTIPIPVPVYNLLALFVERGARDHRGTISFKIDTAPVDVEISNSNALFGESGYFSRTMKSFAGVDYLQQGKRKRPQVILARENDLTKKGDPFSTKVVEIDPLRLVFSTKDGIFSGLEGFDVDNSNLYQILPQMLPGGGLGTVDSRLIQINQDDMFPNGVDDTTRARLAALWITSHVGNACYCVRNVMRYQVNKDLCSEPIRSLLISERLTPYRDLPSSIPKPPNFQETAQVVLAVLEVLNPTLIRHEHYKYLNTLAQYSRHLLCPSVLTESFRAHVSRFLTYNSGSEFTGTMLACPDMEESAGNFQTLAAHFVYDPSKKNFPQVMVNSINVWRQILELYPNLQPAPAISLDYNRVPITVKYCALVEADGNDNTGLDFPVIASKISGSDLVKFLARIEHLGADGAEVAVSILDIMGGNPNIQLLADFVYSLQPNDKNEEPVRLENIQAPVGVLDNAAEVLQQSDPKVQGDYDSKKVYYYFTKFKEPQVILTADKFTSLLHYPVIESHGLVSRGYVKVAKIRVWPSLEISSASVVDQNGKPVTEYGRLLKTLARKGGFGFGSLLGPLLGTAGGAVGDLLGVPGLGDLGGVLGGTLGSLIPF